MQHQSFEHWRFPRELDGVLLLEDHARADGRLAAQERHFHDELELHFVDRGRGVFVLPDGKLNALAGTLLWIPPRKEHLLLEASGDFRRYMLLCRPRLVRRALPADARAQLLGRGAGVRSGIVPPRALRALRETYAEVRADARTPLWLVNAAVAYALTRSWLQFETAGQSPTPEAFHPAVAHCVRALRETRAALPELARGVGLSESHLSKLFAAQIGVSVTEFRNRVGIERFLELYGDGARLTLMAAALDAGFGSYPQFHRVFSRHMGHSPAEHRRRMQARAGSG